MAECIQKKTNADNMLPKETLFSFRSTHRLKMKGRNKKFHADGNQEREGVAIKQTFTQNQSLETERSILKINFHKRQNIEIWVYGPWELERNIYAVVVGWSTLYTPLRACG